MAVKIPATLLVVPKLARAAISNTI